MTTTKATKSKMNIAQRANILFFVALLLVGLGLEATATDVQITNAAYQSRERGAADAVITATLTVSWKNAWRNQKNYDAVWLFFKFNQANETRSQRHGNLKANTARLIHNYFPQTANPAFWMPPDAAGMMVFPEREFRGEVSWRIQVEIEAAKIPNLTPNESLYATPHAVEMVFIPQGAFYLGEADPETQKSDATFFEYGTRQRYRVTSENALTIGTQPGNLAYDNGGVSGYRGDMKGSLSAEFPKGFAAFYVMKYELTQGLYADFLNSISAYWTTNRANFGGRFYTQQRGSIQLEQGVYRTPDRQRPASFLTFEDVTAWTDWAGLRPMTELEYEKAARGPQTPVAQDFPWGTNSSVKLSRYFNDKGDLVWQAPLDEKDLSDANLELFGASYYWVMDLNKSLWERCITVGDERGRQFKGTHGDGVLRDGYFGVASNEDWPNGVDGKGGLSYRGGGTYHKGMVGSPIGFVAQRLFGAWGDGPRDIAYGYRAARSAN